MNKGLYKIPIKRNINNSVRSKYDYFGVKEGIHNGNNICPRYHKIRLYNKISNTKSNMNRGSVGTFKTKTLDKFQTISPKYKSEMNIDIINNNKKEKEKNKNQGKLFLIKI